jgi:uncharacterized protein with HEPN domain
MAASQNVRVRLLHIRDEIRNLDLELGGLDFEIYQDSYGLRRTTDRAIQIVSEAARALPTEFRARYPEAPWADIIAIGNPLRHEYHKIDDRVLWKTATLDLPKLQPIIERMLVELSSE